MTDLYTQARAAADFIRSRSTVQPRLAVILGSGLGRLRPASPGRRRHPLLRDPQLPSLNRRWPLRSASSWEPSPASRSPSCRAASTPTKATRCTRSPSPPASSGSSAVETLIVTNAAGGINPSYGQGAIVAISDHINLTGTNAALGPNEPRFGLTSSHGQRFFDMTAAYSPRLRTLARSEATKQGWTLAEGVYLAVLGPSYETPAEIRAFRTLGADLVGMSTVHEVIVARHMGIEVLGLSVVTNMAAGVLDQPINHEEVMETGTRIAHQFTSLLTALIPQIAPTTAG